MKYKITIGDRVFDAESNGDGTFQMKNGNRDFTMSAVGIEVLEGKIEEVKEPLRVEFTTYVPDLIGKGATPKIEVYGISERVGFYLNGFDGKPVRITIEEILQDQCEHEWDWNGFRYDKKICTKCGEVK